MKKKKGFTLVELLVVIAILAVLATVSVVGYMGFTKKAHESNDIGITTQKNTILQAEEVTNKPSTPHEAVQQLANGGVDVEKLTPTTDGYNYVYDLDTNRMFLLDGNKSVVAPTNIEYTQDLNVFAFVGSENEISNWNGYSIYLKTNFEITSENLFTNLKTGLDVGNNTIESIKYIGSETKEALIRTNGGTLTINAGQDSVYHYGSADKIVVIAVANNSYHEFGEVKGNIEIESGHVQVESVAKVSTIVATPKESTTVKVTVTNENTVGEIVTTDTTKTTLNVPENIKPTENLTDKKLEEMSNFAGGFGTERSPYLISTMDQWVYLASNSKKYDCLATQGNYFSVLTDLDFENVEQNIQIQYFSGHIDFNNHTITNLQESSKQMYLEFNAYGFLFYDIVGDSEIKNLSFTTSSSTIDHGIRLIEMINQKNEQNEDGSNFKVLIENVKMFGFGNYSDNNVGLFVYWVGKSNLTLKNCVNYATIYNQGGFTGVFVGRTYTTTQKYTSYCEKITFDNCINYGTIINTNANNGFASMLISNPSNIIDKMVTIETKNCVNYGTIVASKINLVTGSDDKNIIGNPIVENKGVLSNSTGKSIDIVDGKFSFSKIDNAVRYEMVFSFSGSAIGGGITSVLFKLDDENINSVKALKWIDDSKVDLNNAIVENIYGTTVYTYNNQYVLVDKEATLNSQPSVTVMAYDENNQVIGVYYTYSYTK